MLSLRPQWRLFSLSLIHIFATGRAVRAYIFYEDGLSYSNSFKVTFGFEIISLIDISLLPRLSQIRLASPKTVTRPIYSLLRCIEFSLLIKWGAFTRQSSSLYCPMRNSDQFTIGKTHSTLICLPISMLVTDVGDEFEM